MGTQPAGALESNKSNTVFFGQPIFIGYPCFHLVKVKGAMESYTWV